MIILPAHRRGKLVTSLLFIIQTGAASRQLTASVKSNSCYPPCNPMLPYTSAKQITQVSNLTSIRKNAELQFNVIREELEPIMKTVTHNFLSLHNLRYYSIEVLAPALRRYQEAHVALRQLSGQICYDSVSKNEDLISCRPDVEALPLDPRPLDWAYHALAEKTTISKKEIYKHLCNGRELSFLDTTWDNPAHNLDQIKKKNLDILERSRAKSIANNYSATTLCVRNHLSSHPRMVLSDVFAEWGAANSHDGLHSSLENLGSIRIILYGSSDAEPMVASRSPQGQPLFPRGYMQDRFNIPRDSIVSAAWANFSDWQTLELEFAVNESLMKPDPKWSTSLKSWESMGLDFEILTPNLFARHPKIFPLPLGAPDHFHSTLERCRLSIRKRVTDYNKKHMLLLNFKPFGGPSGSSSSERQAIYRLAALGDPENGVKPWTFANILPSKGDVNFTDTLLQMNHHYDILASSHFVLSPRGNGLDCFRTWEALALGTIPMVKKSGPFDAMYEGLPVLLVSRWEDVTLELLQRTLQEWRHRRFPNLKLISVAGWLHKSA